MTEICLPYGVADNLPSTVTDLLKNSSLWLVVRKENSMKFWFDRHDIFAGFRVGLKVRVVLFMIIEAR